MCVEDAKVLAVNFARNISRKRWGGGRNKTPHLRRKKSNKRTKETSSSLIDFHGK
jgi:hypothetical protein